MSKAVVPCDEPMVYINSQPQIRETQQAMNGTTCRSRYHLGSCCLTHGYHGHIQMNVHQSYHDEPDYTMWYVHVGQIVSQELDQDPDRGQDVG